MKKRTIIIGMFILFLVGVISIIGTYAIDSTITEGNSSTADYLFNITLGDRTNREVVIPSYDSKIVDIKISNPNEFAMSYLLYIEGVNSNISVINIKDTEASGVLASKTTTIIQIFIQNNSNSDITIKIKDIVGFEKETLTLPDNSTGINKGSYYKAIVKSNNNTYGKVKPNIKLSTLNGILKYEIVPNTGYKYKSTTCNGSIANNILTISNITSNINCEVVFEPIEVTVNFDTAGGSYNISTTYTEAKEHTYTVPYSGTYKLEVWGGQGGTANSYRGGYGGYSVGSISLQKNTNIYVNVGGSGTGGYPNATMAGGYNGGGSTGTSSDSSTNRYVASGGGATHIATISGKLSTLSSNKDSILIVAGGGGGGYQHTASGYNGVGGSGGGYLGVNGTKGSSGGGGYGTGGSQTSGGSAYNNTSYGVAGFGYGGVVGSGLHGSSGGGGYYGGGGSLGGTVDSGNSSGGGGSGYIGNSLLTDKYMYCYNCSTSTAESTKTYSTTNVSSSPISDYAKSGGGAAKITFLNADYTTAYGQKYSLPIPTKEGYTFSGWYTGENGTGTKITENTVLSNTNNHTLYAYWTIPTKYTTSGSYTYTVPRNGLYKIELWGAQGGGTSSYPGGYGGYVSGSIMLHENDNLYVYVGENYNGYKNDFSYNGGGRGTVGTSGSRNYNGGGATDVRYFGTYQPTTDDLAWNSTIGLNSRIMVAGGGGGYTDWYDTRGGNGGGLIGYSGNRNAGSIVNSTGGTQVSGGKATDNTTSTPRAGVFGVGGYNGTYAYEWAYEAGGGGGYYGGGSGGAISGSVGSGAGGSSYISGHTGCVAISSDSSRNPRTGLGGASCTTGTSDNLCSSHYSGKLFTDTIMIDGSGYAWTNTKGSTKQMPKPSGGYYASGAGHTGSGAAIITFLGEDTSAPVGTLTASKDYNNINVSVNATDDMAIDHYEYYLSTSATCPTDGYTISSSNSYTYNITSTGTYYVCARVVDTADNVLSLVSQPINYSRIYSVKVRYNVNGGTITPNTSGYTWTTDDTGLIYQNGNIYEQVIRHGTPADLANYNNSEFINITPPNELYVTSGSEWKCLSGCSVTNKIFNQTTKYNTSDFCDVTDNNCTVVLGLNLVGDTTAPTCSLSADASTITASASDTGGSGLGYYGWDSSYSGDNSTSKSISIGTHTYYVKDRADNTGSCSISIIATTKGSYVDCGGNLEDSGGCYYWNSATANASGSCTCRTATSATYKGTCSVSGGTASCSCSSPVTNTCSVSYSCSSGYLAGSSCKIYTSGTTVTTYTCSSGYTKIDNSYCYKTS